MKDTKILKTSSQNTPNMILIQKLEKSSVCLLKIQHPHKRLDNRSPNKKQPRFPKFASNGTPFNKITSASAEDASSERAQHTTEDVWEVILLDHEILLQTILPVNVLN